MLSIADIAVNPEAVAELIPWEFFDAVRVKYERARFERSKRETKKKNGEAKKRRGRPPGCVRKLFHIAQEELSACRDEEPGIGGAPAYDFYSLLCAFLIAPLYECEANAESIWRELVRNPGFVRACGFDPDDIPGVRTLRRFNQTMNEEGLWGEISRITVRNNIELGIIEDTAALVVDPTHHDGFASVHKPVKACRECARIERCKDVLYTCDVTDIVAKSKNYKLPGVKSVVMSLAGSEIPIAAMALNARVFDGKSLGDSLSFVRDRYPGLEIDVVIADGAYDAADNRKIARKVMKADLVTPVCPRRCKKKKVSARGIDHVDAYGIPVCMEGHRMELLGRDEERKQYIWSCPVHRPSRSDETLTCASKCECSPRSGNGRVYRTNADEFPQVNWEFPQHSRKHKKLYAMRTQIERIISRVKRMLSFERFYGRGKQALQGFADRYVAVFNIIAYAAWSI
jgi:hypothetical protein